VRIRLQSRAPVVQYLTISLASIRGATSLHWQEIAKEPEGYERSEDFHTLFLRVAAPANNGIVLEISNSEARPKQQDRQSTLGSPHKVSSQVSLSYL
jgi:hypothetical protein